MSSTTSPVSPNHPTTLLTSIKEEAWNQLRDLFAKLDEAQVNLDTQLRSAYQCHEQLVQNVNNINNSLEKWQELIDLYQSTLSSAKNEAQFLNSAQSSLSKLFSQLYPEDAKKNQSQQALEKGTSIPETIRTISKLPPITIKIGDNVAAKSKDITGAPVWIWAEVQSIQHPFYTVIDVENNEIIEITEKELIPLPPPDSPPFAVGTDVMAIFLNTTAFYKAKVHQLPINGEYLLAFDDDDIQFRSTPMDKVTIYDSEKVARRRRNR